MINSLNLLRNIGCFDNVSSGVRLPFSRLTLVYAENGRGKTTLAEMLRSLANGDPIPIRERRRLGAQHDPHLVVSCIGGPPDAIFQNGAWNRTLPQVVIFDDIFVDENVYSGLVVATDHRQNLHELILGGQGVALNRQLQALIEQIEQHNSELRRLGGAIPATERGALSVDDFCALPVNQDVDQEIAAAEQNLAASRQQDPIRSTPSFQSFELPGFDLDGLATILSSGVSNLDAVAAARVQEHLRKIGEDSERWIAAGVRRQEALQAQGVEDCVFCAQNLSASPVIAHYRAFFGDEYRNLQRGIQDAITSLGRTHSKAAAVSFEHTLGVNVERRQFWAQFGQMPELAVDSAVINSEWDVARRRIEELLSEKRNAPLDSIAIPEDVRALVESYEAHRRRLATLNQELTAANKTISAVKQRAATANPIALTSTLNLLKATKARHSLATAALCTSYLQEKHARVATEQQRNQARQALEQYRTRVFPTYEAAINRYLQRFNAGFHLDSVAAVNTRGGPTCNYNLLINNMPVAVGGGDPQPGNHSFRNVLSAGDRNALALAFFLASLELDPNRRDLIVVIDDPVSSLDEHRSLTTVQ